MERCPCYCWKTIVKEAGWSALEVNLKQWSLISRARALTGEIFERLLLPKVAFEGKSLSKAFPGS